MNSTQNCGPLGLSRRSLGEGGRSGPIFEPNLTFPFPMKLAVSLLFLSLITPTAFSTPSASGTALAKKPCCCAHDDAAPADAAVTAQPKLSAKSIYQLDSSWTNDQGAAVSLATLRGRPVVLAMFFASCEYACPVLVSDMQRLRQSLPENVRERAQFVLVTFDPARDTPDALHTYRERSALDGGWTLLHGDAESVQELAMLLGVKYKQDARGQFSHSNLITVLNDEGEISFQRAGLMGDVSEAAKEVGVAAQ